MEGDTSDLKQDESFEILPHLSEYDIFVEMQKSRFLNKYGNNSTSETNSISTSNVWTISESEFYEIRNPSAAESESDIILQSTPDPDKIISRNQSNGTLKFDSCIQELDHHCENSAVKPKSEINATDLQLVPYDASRMVIYDGECSSTKNKEFQTETGQNLHLGFQLNNNTERIVDIVSDKIVNRISVDNHQILRENKFTCVDINLIRKENIICNSGNENRTVFVPCEEITQTKAAVQFYRGRSKSSKRICQAVDTGIKLCKWFKATRIVSTVVEEAKSSFYSFVNLFEMDLNRMMGIKEEPLKLTIVTEEEHCKAIEEAFSVVFRGRMEFAWFIPVLDSVSIPALPVGHLAGVQTAEMKIHCSREHVGDIPLISTSTLIYEAIPQRWQMTTVICIDDPKLNNLKMHNFTLSTPIPNEYVAEAVRCTPASYPQRDLGVAVNIEQAISNLTPAIVKDAQEFMTGFNSYNTLKSAAGVLAGMYKRYV